jgi:hypothetical protein
VRVHVCACVHVCVRARARVCVRAQVWAKKMMQLSQTLDEWMTAQRNWMYTHTHAHARTHTCTHAHARRYLESIFGQGDIQKQLPDEAAKFLKVDQYARTHARIHTHTLAHGCTHVHAHRFWKETMRATNKAPNVIEAVCTPTRSHAHRHTHAVPPGHDRREPP